MAFSSNKDTNNSIQSTSMVSKTLSPPAPTKSVASSNKQELAPLPYNFVPGPFDVVCARGAKVKKHAGNQMFREKIQESVQAYAAAADSKLYKSMVVSAVVDFFRERSEGGFVKQLKLPNGSISGWFRISDCLAREKVGQAMRERLSHQYRSSTKAKRRRWKQESKDVMSSVLQNINAVKMQKDTAQQEDQEQEATPEVVVSEKKEQQEEEGNEDAAASTMGADAEEEPSTSNDNSSSSCSGSNHHDDEDHEEDDEEPTEEDFKFLKMFTLNNMQLLGTFQQSNEFLAIEPACAFQAV
jgi:hypothetical protein